MFFRRLIRSPRARRGLAAGVIVLSLGGLALARVPAGSGGTIDQRASDTRAHLSGPRLDARFALSHARVLRGDDERVFAELTLTSRGEARQRAPLSMVVVLDTSGSMAGEKLAEAKRSVLTLVEQMHDGDEIAIVRYSSEAQLLQPLSRVGDVRESLRARVRSLTATGGTNIPWGLSAGVDALRDAGDGRVRRVVLVSDGLDESRAQAEGIAQRQAQRGVTLSSLGIGLDFDESYLSAVSRAGHGNFGFVQNASSLQRFLARELKETAGTVVEGAVARLRLPSGVRMVRLVGADGEQHGDELEIRVGSLSAGAQRSVVVELEVDADLGDQLRFDTRLSWQPVGGSSAEARFATLKMVASADEEAVADARDGEIFARAVSALASWQQLRAVEAFGRGDREEARRLIDANIRELKQAAKAAPEAADELDAQVNSYDSSRATLSEAAPASPAARAAAKRAYEKNTANLSYEAF